MCQKATPVSAYLTQSLNTGSLPSEWTMAHVSPIYKKGSRVAYFLRIIDQYPWPTYCVKRCKYIDDKFIYIMSSTHRPLVICLAKYTYSCFQTLSVSRTSAL